METDTFVQLDSLQEDSDDLDRLYFTLFSMHKNITRKRRF